MKDIYFFLTSHQIEKEKKKWMMGINLTSVDVVTSLVGGLTSSRNLCMHFDFPRPLAQIS